MNQVLKGISLGAAVACLFVVHDAAAACFKWRNTLSHCNVSSYFCNHPTSEATEAQLRYYYARLFGDTAAEACKRWGQALYGVDGRVYTATNGAVQCWVDGDPPVYDPNGKLDEYDPISTVIQREEIPREACCEVDLEGFHELTPDVWYQNAANGSIVTLPPRAGLEFTEDQIGPHLSQKSQIRGDNYANVRGAYLSDLYRPNEDIPAALKAAEHCGGTLQVTHPDWRCRPQIDHIIPRKDIKGCDCGTNSSKNAQVISAGLNNFLGNFCGDSDAGRLRWDILNYYSGASLASNTQSRRTYASTGAPARMPELPADFALVLQYQFTKPRDPSVAFIGIAPTTSRSVMSFTPTARAL